VTPRKPPEKWLVAENRGWLMARGLETKGLAKELRDLVKIYRAEEGGAPPVLQGGGGNSRNFQDTVLAAIRMIAVVMQDFVDDDLLLEMEYRIKVFMTRFDIFDCGLRKEKQKPKWLTSYNFYPYLIYRWQLVYWDLSVTYGRGACWVKVTCDR